MTDPEMADVTYVEPLTPLFAEQIIAVNVQMPSWRPSVDKLR